MMMNDDVDDDYSDDHVHNLINECIDKPHDIFISTVEGLLKHCNASVYAMKHIIRVLASKPVYMRKMSSWLTLLQSHMNVLTSVDDVRYCIDEIIRNATTSMNINHDNYIQTYQISHIIELLPSLFSRLMSADLSISSTNDHIIDYIYKCISALICIPWSKSLIILIYQIMLQLPLLPIHWLLLQRKTMRILNVGFMNNNDNEEKLCDSMTSSCLCGGPSIPNDIIEHGIHETDWVVFIKIVLNIFKECIYRCSHTSLHDYMLVASRDYDIANELLFTPQSLHCRLWVHCIRIIMRRAPSKSLPNICFVFELSLQQSPDLCNYILNGLSSSSITPPHSFVTCTKYHSCNQGKCGHSISHTDLTILFVIYSALNNTYDEQAMKSCRTSITLLHTQYIQQQQQDVFNLWINGIFNISSMETHTDRILQVIQPWIELNDDEPKHVVHALKTLCQNVLVRMFSRWSSSRRMIIDYILNGISIGGTNTDKQESYAHILEYIVYKCAIMCSQEVISRVIDWFGYLSHFSLNVGRIAIRSVLPLCRTNRQFMDTFIIVIKKLLSSRHVAPRQLSIYGLIHLFIAVTGLPSNVLPSYSNTTTTTASSSSSSSNTSNIRKNASIIRNDSDRHRLEVDIINTLAVVKRFPLQQRRDLYSLLIHVTTNTVTMNMSTCFENNVLDCIENIYIDLLSRCVIPMDNIQSVYVAPIIYMPSCIDTSSMHEHLGYLIYGLWSVERNRQQQQQQSCTHLISLIAHQVSSPMHLIWMLCNRKLNAKITTDDMANKAEVRVWFDIEMYRKRIRALPEIMTLKYVQEYETLQKHHMNNSVYEDALQRILYAPNPSEFRMHDLAILVVYSMTYALSGVYLNDNNNCGMLLFELASMWRHGLLKFIHSSSTVSIDMMNEIDSDLNAFMSRDIICKIIDEFSNSLLNHTTTIRNEQPSWSSLSLPALNNALRILGVYLDDITDVTDIIPMYERMLCLFQLTIPGNEFSYTHYADMLNVSANTSVLRYHRQPIIQLITSSLMQYGGSDDRVLKYIQQIYESGSMQYFDNIYDIRYETLRYIRRMTERWLEHDGGDDDSLCRYTTLLKYCHVNNNDDDGKNMYDVMKMHQNEAGEMFTHAKVCEMLAYYMCKWLSKEVSLGVTEDIIYAYLNCMHSIVSCCHHHFIHHSDDNQVQQRTVGGVMRKQLPNVPVMKDGCYCKNADDDDDDDNIYQVYWQHIWPVKTETTHTMLSMTSILRHVLVNECIDRPKSLSYFLCSIFDYSGLRLALVNALNTVIVTLANEPQIDSNTIIDERKDEMMKDIVTSLYESHLYQPPACRKERTKNVCDIGFVDEVQLPMQLCINEECRTRSLHESLLYIYDVLFYRVSTNRRNCNMYSKEVRKYLRSETQLTWEQFETLCMKLCNELTSVSYIMIPVIAHCEIIMKYNTQWNTNNNLIVSSNTKLRMILDLIFTICASMSKIFQYSILYLLTKHNNYNSGGGSNNNNNIRSTTHNEEQERKRLLRRKRKRMQAKYQSGHAFFEINDNDDGDVDDDDRSSLSSSSSSSSDEENNDNILCQLIPSKWCIDVVIFNCISQAAAFSMKIYEFMKKLESYDKPVKHLKRFVLKFPKLRRHISKSMHQIDSMTNAGDRVQHDDCPVKVRVRVGSRSGCKNVPLSSVMKRLCEHVQHVLTSTHDEDNVENQQQQQQQQRGKKRRRKQPRLRSRNAWIDKALAEDDIVDDDYRDMEDFLVVNSNKY